jgi:hypothetical protein
MARETTPGRLAEAGFMAGPVGKSCTLCGHPWNDHRMLAEAGPVAVQGITLCPVEGCACRSTWDAPQLIAYLAEVN